MGKTIFKDRFLFSLLFFITAIVVYFTYSFINKGSMIWLLCNFLFIYTVYFFLNHCNHKTTKPPVKAIYFFTLL
ncbi:MAG: hypothetical protein AAF518_22810, partial [Spirochaetota bacterium]